MWFGRAAAALWMQKRPNGRSSTEIVRLMAKWRSTLIQNTIVKEYGTAVQSGPFKRHAVSADNRPRACHVPKLLGGSYRAGAAPAYRSRHRTRLSRHHRDRDGRRRYYAVGLAMRMPNANVHAFDTNEEAHACCREVGKLNNVPDRVKIGGLFNGEDFARYPAGTLVFCDIEGAEDVLLDPDKCPALRKMDLIVELHECLPARHRAQGVRPVRGVSRHRDGAASRPRR